jgi:hypothetical protein
MQHAQAEPLDTAICPNHGGRIAQGLAQGDYYGKRYWCPIGNKVWTLTQRPNDMRRPLNYPKLGIL